MDNAKPPRIVRDARRIFKGIFVIGMDSNV